MITRREFLRNGSFWGLGLLSGCSIKNRFDIILKNGTIFDGLGNSGKKLDVGIKSGKITAIDKLERSTADVIIDAGNKFISPGFIDIHTHTDMELLANPKAESKIRQGITTEVSGNCGFSPFPLKEEEKGELNDEYQKKYGIPVTWNNLDGFFQAIEARSTALNYMTFTGHGDLRTYAVGKNDVKPTADQMENMKRLLSRSMEFGSLGLSTGLEYAPGSYAETGELIELCHIVKKHNGVYATHMRNEDAEVEEAIKEAITISKESGVSLQISHLKACNRPNWHKVDNMLDLIHSAKNSGLPVMADRYPYNAWGTDLATFLPLWARQGNSGEILARIRDKKLIPKLRKYCEKRAYLIGGWDHILISSCDTEKNKKWEGRYISECAELTGKDPIKFTFDLLFEEKLKVGVIGFAMDEGNLKKILADPLVVIGSDGSVAAPYGKLSRGKPHPRYYGSFPRVLGKYCRQEKIFDWPIAIKKMTSQSADKLGLDRRGSIKKGYFADITIFDPKTVIDKADFSNPHQYPTGIEYVIVNGKIVVNKGRHTGQLPGMILRGGM